MVFHRRTRSVSVVVVPVVVEVDDSSVTSVTSTISCHNDTVKLLSSQPPLPQHVLSTTTATTQKSVRFDLTANQLHAPVLDKDECANLWYQAVEYKYFKHSTMCAARGLVQAEAKNRAPFSYQRVMERTYAACLQAAATTVEPEQEQPWNNMTTTFAERKHLNRWAQVAPNRVGLEKWSLRRVVHDKQQRRLQLVDFIMDVQQQTTVVATKANYGTHTTNHNDDREEFIRRTCERISRPSRLFAAEIAQANAVAFQIDMEQSLHSSSSEESCANVEVHV